jgi:formylglycine-generating enzyme required for sulfatase activity
MQRKHSLVLLLVLFLSGTEGLFAADQWVESKTGMVFVSIPAGCFTMGQAETEAEVLARLRTPFSEKQSFGDELPPREVCLDKFNIGQHEVTVTAFRVFVEATGYVTDAENQGSCQEYRTTGYKWKANDKLYWDDPGFPQKGNEPVVCVSWNDSKAFAEWLTKSEGGRSFRLATEAEWEYVARERGSGSKYAAASDDLATVGWYVKNSPRRTSLVGSRKAGGLGIHDLSGNVWEWVADFYSNNYRDLGENNPSGPESGLFRVTRGGGWNSFAWNCRVANRDHALPSHSDTNQGFRLVFTD